MGDSRRTGGEVGYFDMLSSYSHLNPVLVKSAAALPVEERRRVRAELSKLSPTETQIINAKFPTTCDSMQRDAYVLVETKGYIKNNGSGILGMVYTRFKDK